MFPALLRSVAVTILLIACGGDATPDAAPATSSTVDRMLGRHVDEVPKRIDGPDPFRYTDELYAAKVQGDVVLRLVLDSTGTVIGDSTRVDESSGNAKLDSAAVRGARAVRFTPAKRDGRAVSVPILLPVYFRHPEARPLPGDSLLKRP